MEASAMLSLPTIGRQTGRNITQATQAGGKKGTFGRTYLTSMEGLQTGSSTVEGEKADPYELYKKVGMTPKSERETDSGTLYRPVSALRNPGPLGIPS